MKQIYQFIEQTLGMDKVAHFFGVAFLAAFVSLLFFKFDPGDSSVIYGFEGFLAGIIIAIGKEVFDVFNNRTFDFGDVWAGVTGAAVSFLIMGVFL